MILSVSRRTDIPNYYSEWFYNRIKEGFLFKKGKIIRKIPQDKIVEELKKEILEMVK